MWMLMNKTCIVWWDKTWSSRNKILKKLGSSKINIRIRYRKKRKLKLLSFMLRKRKESWIITLLMLKLPTISVIEMKEEDFRSKLSTEWLIRMEMSELELTDMHLLALLTWISLKMMQLILNNSKIVYRSTL